MKKYRIKYQENAEVKELVLTQDSLSKQNLPKNILEVKEEKFSFKLFDKKSIKDKDVNLLFYELSLMLESNISFNDSINILIKNKKNKKIVALLETIKSNFFSKDLEDSLKSFNLNYMVVAFLKISQETGNINSNIKALSKLLNESYEIKKGFFKAISYPIFLFISFIISLFCIFYFVIPKFKMIFLDSNIQKPLATKILLELGWFFETYSLYFALFVFLIFGFIFYLYKTNERLNYYFDEFLVKKLYLVKDIYTNMQMYKIFLVFDIMLSSKYEFHKALVSSKVLLKNNYLLDKIGLIDKLLQNGKTISESFSKTELFDDIVLNLINTGEVSNSLSITVGEIKKIYKNRFDENIKLLTSLIQPIFLVMMMLLILWIVLAIFVPIWDMGSMIKV